MSIKEHQFSVSSSSSESGEESKRSEIGKFWEAIRPKQQRKGQDVAAGIY